jgi:CO dehydrogenase maturation factor
MSKIAVCGKGGSGKSAVTALLAKGLIRRGHPVLVIDSDESNTGIYRLLGFPAPPAPLLESMGGKQKLEEDLVALIKSGVPEISVQLFQREISLSELPDPFLARRGSLRLVVVGKIAAALEGCSCPMGIISRSFLSKLRVSPGEVVLTDMEAGLEHFGRGVETGIDSVLVVVDPSLDSLEIAEKITLLSAQIAIGDVWAVLNRIPAPEYSERLSAELQRRGVSIVGTIRQDPGVFESSLEGSPVSGALAEEDIERILDRLFP